MSTSQPPSDFGEKLLASARADEPPAASTQRALDLVEATPGVRGVPAAERASRRWMLWTLPAAAAVIGGVALAALGTAGGPAASAPATPVSHHSTGTATSATTAIHSTYGSEMVRVLAATRNHVMPCANAAMSVMMSSNGRRGP